MGLPDNTSAPLFSRLSRVGLPQGDSSGTAPAGSGAAPPSGIRLLTVTREGEAIAVASGLWLGGASPVVVIQNTGLLEAGDALRGTASRMGAPLLLLVTCRGYETARALGVDPATSEITRDFLVRADLDSVAPMTEPTLRAWGIPRERWTDARDLDPVRRGWTRAQREERPVAVLVEGGLA